MNIRDLTNKLTKEVISNSFIETKFHSPYPTSPLSAKRGCFYVITQGDMELLLEEDGTKLVLQKGSIIQIMKDDVINKLAYYNGKYAKYNKETNIPIYIEVCVTDYANMIDYQIAVVSTKSFKSSKCTLEPLSEISINGKFVGNQFLVEDTIQTLSLMLGDFYSVCCERETCDVRSKFSLNQDLIVNVECQYLNLDCEWITFDTYQIKPDYTGEMFKDVIDLNSIFEYREQNLQRLSREIPGESERKLLCEALFKVAPIDAILASGRDKQEVADYILNSIGYSSIYNVLNLAQSNTLTQEEINKLQM